MTRPKTTFTEIMRVSRGISVAAQEERLRVGHPAIDLDHLFLALLIVGGPATTLLDEHGVTLDRARNAVASVHRSQLAALGVTVAAPAPRRLEPERSSVEFTDRALTVMQRSDPASYELDILVALLDDSSGLIDRLLVELGVPAAELRAAAVTRIGTSRPAAPATSSWPEVSRSGFVPAPRPEVYALLADPHRRSEWGAAHERCEVGDDGVLTTYYAPDPPLVSLKRRLSWLRSDHTVVAAEPDRMIAWSVDLTGSGRRRGQARLQVELFPEGTGTRLDWRYRPPSSPRLPLLRSFWRWAVSQQLYAHNAGVSRALR